MQRTCATLSSVASIQYFSTLSHKHHHIRHRVTEHKMCVFSFSLQLLSETCTPAFTQSTRHSCQILMKHEFSRQVSKKYSNINFHENPSSGSRVVPSGRTDGHDEPNGRFSQFGERA